MIDRDLDAAYLKAAANRIRLLEAENASFADDLNEAIARIEALEAALRPFSDTPYSTVDLLGADPATYSICAGITVADLRRARAALAPEQKK